MSDEDILFKGGDESDIERYAKQNGADMTTDQDNQKARECAAEIAGLLSGNSTLEQWLKREIPAIIARHYPADEQDWKQMAVELATNYHNHGMLPKQHPQRETCPRCKTLAKFDAMMEGTTK